MKPFFDIFIKLFVRYKEQQKLPLYKHAVIGSPSVWELRPPLPA